MHSNHGFLIKGRMARCQQGQVSDLSLRKNVFFENPKSKFLFCFVMNKKHLSVCQKDPFIQLHPICHHPKYTLIAKYTNTVTGLPFLPIGASRLLNSTLELGLKKVQKSLIKSLRNLKEKQILF